MIFIGVDPGKTGFITIYDSDKKEYSSAQILLLPTKKSGLDVNTMTSWFLRHIGLTKIFDKDYIICYLEDIHSIYGMSAKSNFSFGEIYGEIKTLLKININQENINLVQPKEWQKEMHKGIEKNKDKKVMSLQAAQKLFPDMDFKRTERCTTPDHNLIDSLLICEYAKRKYYEAKK